jgi:hypothetical protein
MPSAAPNSWGESIWDEAMPGVAPDPWEEEPMPGAAPGGWPEGRPPGHVPSPGALEVVDAGSGTPARVLGATAFGATLRLELELLSDGSQVQAEVPSLGSAARPSPGTIVGLALSN